MILVTHAVAGGAAALLFESHPLAAFAAGFVSHFILDAIPHWHYPLSSLVEKKNGVGIAKFNFLWSSPLFLLDVLKTGLDCFAGIAIAFLSIRHAHPAFSNAVVAGAVGGVFPDLLQLAYYAFPKSFLKHLQKLHISVHAKRRLDHEPLLGITSQLAVLIIFAIAIAH